MGWWNARKDKGIKEPFSRPPPVANWLGFWAFTPWPTFSPWLGNRDPTSHVAGPKIKKREIKRTNIWIPRRK